MIDRRRDSKIGAGTVRNLNQWLIRSSSNHYEPSRARVRAGEVRSPVISAHHGCPRCPHLRQFGDHGRTGGRINSDRRRQDRCSLCCREELPSARTVTILNVLANEASPWTGYCTRLPRIANFRGEER